MGNLAFSAKGLSTTLELYTDHITIKRHFSLRTLLNYGLKGDKNIRLDKISAIQFKKAGMTSGYIQFTIVGAIESSGGLMEAMSDENTVLFGKSEQSKFEMLQQKIEALQRGESIDSRGNVASKFRVLGVDKASGFDTEMMIEASTNANAKVKAELKGMIVTSVECIIKPKVPLKTSWT